MNGKLATIQVRAYRTLLGQILASPAEAAVITTKPEEVLAKKDLVPEKPRNIQPLEIKPPATSGDGVQANLPKPPEVAAAPENSIAA